MIVPNATKRRPAENQAFKPIKMRALYAINKRNCSGSKFHGSGLENNYENPKAADREP